MTSERSAKQIKFISACPPPLAAGDYAVSVEQRVKVRENGKKKASSKKDRCRLEFSVDAPRFALSPSDIHSVFPPVGSVGRFDNTLPHVVFTQRSLPWERNVPGEPAKSPWMALLLLSEDELEVKHSAAAKRPECCVVKTMPIFDARRGRDSLLSPRESSARILMPQLDGVDFATGEGRAWIDARPRFQGASCRTIDLPFALFSAVAPRRADLPYLAHVRSVDTDDKEVSPDSDFGRFSLVVGNRVPQPNKQYLALLISTDGLGPILCRTTAHEDTSVRLVVLADWTFSCQGSRSFKTVMRQLNNGGRGADSARVLDSPWLCLPVGQAEDDAADFVRQVFSFGYTALDHAMRHGERTVSWYRGPLVPIDCEKPVRDREPATCADELLRYDPDTGLFDVSYAAAWQLGRLLALNNHGFASALNRLRAEYRNQARHDVRYVELSAVRREMHLPSKMFFEDGLMSALARCDCGNNETTPVAESEKAEPDALFRKAMGGVVEKGPEQIPDEVSEWLGRLVLLYGVPFCYLIPEKAMLPKESLKFFYLDPVWIRHLVQGACSVGNIGFSGRIVDTAMSRWLQPGPEVNAVVDPVSRAAAGVRSGLRRTPAPSGAAPDNTGEETGGLDWPLTGFLLRSSVVDGYRGLEIAAYRKSEAGGAPSRLMPLRIEQLSQDTLIGVFNGRVDELAVRQPGEGLHFGLTPIDGGYVKIPRNREGDLAPEHEIRLSGAPYLRQSAGVIDIAALAGALEERFRDGQDGDNGFTSAEFAFQMVEAPAEIRFVYDGTTK